MSDDPARAHTLSAIEPVGEDPMIGRVLDERYRIVGRLGQGGMGIVYSARHEVLGARVAIKVLRADTAGEDEAIERLTREAQAASAIGNEHIVDVRDFGRLDDGSTFVVMELIDGVDLYNVVRAAPLPWKRARHVALQICEALQAAHEQGIVHRDLKLENVLLTSRRGDPDFVKVVDFGIAKVQGSAKITIAGRVIGTPEYMSPEQCMGRAVDHRSDIYSLGVMLYEMITGKLPFYDEDLAKLVRMQITEKPVPPSRVRADLDLPLALEAVILRCLAKDPAARFSSMRAVADALGALEPAPGAAPEPPEPAERDVVVARAATTGGAAASRPGRMWIVPALGLVALSAIVAVVAVVIGGDAEPQLATESMAGASPTESDALDPEEPDEADVAARAPDPADAPPVAATATDTPPAVVERASAQITVESTPPRARVFDAEGALLGQTPFLVRRPAAGQRVELVVREDGYLSHSIALSDLSAAELRVVLARRPVAPRPSAPQPAPEPTRQPQQAPPPAPEPRAHQEFRDPWGDEQ